VALRVQLQERFSPNHCPAQIFTFNQGLTLVHQYLPALPVVVADIWVKAGATAEPQDWFGMAHFLEHMIFKGTKRIPPGVFDQMIEHRGGMTNAATSHDYAHFFLTTATDYLPETLPYLAEILLQAEIPEAEFYCEREVVLEEIRGSDDDPDWLAFQSLCQQLYPHHPYGRSVLGQEAGLLNLTPNQMRCFHRTHYQPENLTVVLVGDVEEHQALHLIQEIFEEFAPRSECPPLEPCPDINCTIPTPQTLCLENLGPQRLMLGWRGPGIVSLEENIGLDLLSAILAGGHCSRLIQELREEKQIVLDLQSSFSLQKESSLFSITAWLEPQFREEVEEMILQHIHSLHCHPVSEQELARAQRLLCNDYIFSTETPCQLAGLYGYYQTFASAEWASYYPRWVRSFAPPALQVLAQKYLSLQGYGRVDLVPL